MQDKIKLEFKSPKNKSLEYGESVIEIRPFLKIEEQVLLIDNYLINYFNLEKLEKTLVPNSEYDYMKAEYNMIHSIFHLLTNVDAETLNTDMYDASPLWIQVREKITNFEEFYKRLERVVSDVKEQIINKNSLGNTISGLSDKLVVILDNFSKFTPEDIEKAKQTGMELLSKIENSPAQEMIAEGVVTAKRKSKAK